MLIVTQPKSGTTYINAAMTNYFGYNYFSSRNILRPNKAMLIQASDFARAAKHFAHADAPIVDHFQITDSVLKEIIKQKCKVVFVPRDPRSAIVSKIIHEVVLDGAHGWQDDLNIHKEIEQKRKAILDQVNRRLVQEVHQRVKDLNIWKERKERHPNTVYIVNFELLKSDRPNFFYKIVEPFGYNKNNFDPAKVLGPKWGKNRVRGSNPDEWRDFVSKELLAEVNLLLPDELMKFYGWKR